MSLAGKRAVVTGAATGIGAAAVSSFLDAGAQVTGVYHSSPPPDELRDSCAWIQCDARDRGQVTVAFKAAAKAMGGIDVLLAAAGIWQGGAPETLDDDDLDFVLDTNLKTTVHTNQAAFEHMKASGGRIINLGSGEAVRGNPAAPHYAAAKAAIQAWTRSAATAWGRFGITVNALAPAVRTSGARRVLEHLGPAGEAWMQRTLETMPIRGDLGDPRADLGPAMVFLASDGSGFITGQLIAVNGGLQMLGA